MNNEPTQWEPVEPTLPAIIPMALPSHLNPYDSIPPPPPSPKQMRYSVLLVFVLCTVIITGSGVFLYTITKYNPSSTSVVKISPTATAVPLTAVDWQNFTYHTSKCGTFTLHNNQAITQTPTYFNAWTVGSPVYGNITGQTNAVILYTCSSGAGDPHVYALIYTGSAKYPQILADLVLQSGGYTGGSINSATILENKTLQLTGSGYASGDPDCCPSLFVTTDYHWDGSSFVVASSNSVVLTPTPTPIPAPTQPPVLSTAWDLYNAFINAGIAMGNAGNIPNSSWSPYYPGKGGTQFIDEASGGTMEIALFNTYSGAQTDAQAANSTYGWGTYLLGTCLLLYRSSSTNLTPYEQVMQQDCS